MREFASAALNASKHYSILFLATTQITPTRLFPIPDSRSSSALYNSTMLFFLSLIMLFSLVLSSSLPFPQHPPFPPTHFPLSIPRTRSPHSQPAFLPYHSSSQSISSIAPSSSSRSFVGRLPQLPSLTAPRQPPYPRGIPIIRAPWEKTPEPGICFRRWMWRMQRL